MTRADTFDGSDSISTKERQRIEEAALHAIAMAIKAQTESS
jgi:hypothetical protein